MDRGAWQAAIHRITRVGRDWSDLAHMLAYICGCIYMYICTCESPSVMSDSLCPHELYSSWNSPGRNTGVGSLSQFQRIFPTQESNSALLHHRWILFQLSYQESLDICIYIADSLHCTAEANNIIKQLYSKKKKKGTGFSFHPTSALPADIQHRHGVRQPSPVRIGETKGPDALQHWSGQEATSRQMARE